MKRTVDFSDFRRAFNEFNRADQFSDAGLRLIFDHIESIEGDTGVESELDVIAICCEYSEYDDFASLREAFEHLDLGDDPEQIIDRIEREVTILRRDYKSTDGPFIVNG